MNFRVQQIKEKTSVFLTKQIREHRIRFLAILALIPIVIIAGIVIGYRCQAIENAASEKLSSALSAFAQGDQQKGFSLIEETIKKYPKTPVAYEARILKADILTELKEYDEALKILEETADKGKPDLIKPLASIRIIYVYDSKQDFFNAILAAKNFITKYPDHFLIKDVYLSLAEYYFISGSKDEAVKVFNEILVNFPATLEAEKAQNRLTQIN
jgi:tetratricopeptide (TPR) repeat protein